MRFRQSLAFLSLVFTLQAFATPLEFNRQQRDKLKKETVYAIDLIQRYHYKQTSLSDIDARQLLDRYMSDLDGTRLFFLQEDIDFIQQRFATSLKPSYLYVGDLYPAFEIFNLYAQRVADRMAWIHQRLDQPFDLDSNRTYAPDRSEADWPASSSVADDLWDRRITNELILELLDDHSTDSALNTIRRRYERTQRFLDEFEVHNVQEAFLTALATMYDPHSSFFSWDSAREFDIQISNALVGIGAQLRDIDGYCVIERLLPGGPAEMSGAIHPGDKIVAVAQGNAEPVDVVGMKLRKVVQQIRGKEGTEVKLTVQPAGGAKRKVVHLVREKVELTASLASAALYHLPIDPAAPNADSLQVGVIELPSFYGEGEYGEGSISTSRDIEELITKLKAESVDAIVLDFRRNGGGRLDEAIKLTGLFIPTGPVVMKRNYDGSIDQDWDRDPAVAWDGPLLVLTSRSSASASEIVAGALQAHRRALVIGDESTHGKGTVQAPIDLRSAMRRLPIGGPLEVGTVKVTVQQFYLPDGASTQNRGVLADLPIPSANMFLLDGEADLDNALEWDQIAPIPFELPHKDELATVNDTLLDALRNAHAQRLASLPEFQFLTEQIDWIRERDAQTTVSLNLAERTAEKDTTEARRDAFEARRKALAAAADWLPTDVDLDLTASKEAAHQSKLASTPLPNGSPRANAFYQKVFYYQPSPSDPIKEIWVEFFDYSKALDDPATFTALFAEHLLPSISEDETIQILTALKNADRFADFSVEAHFHAVLGERLDSAKLDATLPRFFKAMIAADPRVLRDRAELDIPLREALRVARDWVRSSHGILPTVAQNLPNTKSEIPSIDAKSPIPN